MTIDPSKYTIAIQKRDVDGETLFTARVKELPDVEVFETTSEQAYSVALEIITSLASLADEDNRKFPVPSETTDEEFSGRVTLRMPRGLHKQIAAISDQESVSLNQYIVTVLASAAGEKSYFLRTTKEVTEAFAKAIALQDRDQYSRVAAIGLGPLVDEKWMGMGKRFVQLSKYSLTAQSTLEDDDRPYAALRVPSERAFGKVK